MPTHNFTRDAPDAGYQKQQGACTGATTSVSGKPLHNNGGALQTGYKTVASCENDCNKNAKCFAFSHGGSKANCWLYGKSSRGNGKGGQCFVKTACTSIDIADSWCFL